VHYYCFLLTHFAVLAKENYASILSPYSSSAVQHSHPIVSCQMTTAIAIEDVRREVRILSSLSGHNNLVQFYDAFEDEDNVYIVME
jgi:serine/threonine protein kinase